MTKNLFYTYYLYNGYFCIQFPKAVWHMVSVNMGNSGAGNPLYFTTTLPDLQLRDSDSYIKLYNISISEVVQ